MRKRIERVGKIEKNKKEEDLQGLFSKSTVRISPTRMAFDSSR